MHSIWFWRLYYWHLFIVMYCVRLYCLCVMCVFWEVSCPIVVWQNLWTYEMICVFIRTKYFVNLFKYDILYYYHVATQILLALSDVFYVVLTWSLQMAKTEKNAFGNFVFFIGSAETCCCLASLILWYQTVPNIVHFLLIPNIYYWIICTCLCSKKNKLFVYRLAYSYDIAFYSRRYTSNCPSM